MKRVLVEGIKTSGRKIYTANEIPTSLNDLDTALTYSVIYNGADAETEFSLPFDFIKLNDNVGASNGFAIGYLNGNDIAIILSQKDKVGFQVTDGNDATSFTAEKDKMEITSTEVDIAGTDIKLTGDNLTFNGVDVKPQVISNTSVSNWSADATYTGYGYRAEIQITGVTSNDIPEVIFGATESISGNYLPIAESHSGGIYIYSKVNDTITIPTIIIQKRSVII